MSVHQSTYIKKSLNYLNMDKAYPLSSPIVVQLLDMKNDSFRHCENDENLLGPKYYILGLSVHLCTFQILLFFMLIY